jgi:hypothetical protein
MGELDQQEKQEYQDEARQDQNNWQGGWRLRFQE